MLSAGFIKFESTALSGWRAALFIFCNKEKESLYHTLDCFLSLITRENEYENAVLGSSFNRIAFFSRDSTDIGVNV